MSGLALWDLAVKNPHKMLEKLKIAPPMSETITLAICREIVGKGCLSRMPAAFTSVAAWLRSDEVKLQAHDADGDGKLSTQEFHSMPATFTCLDGDQNGYVSSSEIAQLKQRFFGSPIANLRPAELADWFVRCVPIDETLLQVSANKQHCITMAPIQSGRYRATGFQRCQ